MLRSPRLLQADAINNTVSRTIGWWRVCWGAMRRAARRHRKTAGHGARHGTHGLEFGGPLTEPGSFVGLDCLVVPTIVHSAAVLAGFGNRFRLPG
jgi:hypothetical protein